MAAISLSATNIYKTQSDNVVYKMESGKSLAHIAQAIAQERGTPSEWKTICTELAQLNYGIADPFDTSDAEGQRVLTHIKPGDYINLGEYGENVSRFAGTESLPDSVLHDVTQTAGTGTAAQARRFADSPAAMHSPSPVGVADFDAASPLYGEAHLSTVTDGSIGSTVFELDADQQTRLQDASDTVREFAQYLKDPGAVLNGDINEVTEDMFLADAPFGARRKLNDALFDLYGIMGEITHSFTSNQIEFNDSDSYMRAGLNHPNFRWWQPGDPDITPVQSEIVDLVIALDSRTRAAGEIRFDANPADLALNNDLDTALRFEKTTDDQVLALLKGESTLQEVMAANFGEDYSHDLLSPLTQVQEQAIASFEDPTTGGTNYLTKRVDRAQQRLRSYRTGLRRLDDNTKDMLDKYRRDGNFEGVFAIYESFGPPLDADMRILLQAQIERDNDIAQVDPNDEDAVLTAGLTDRDDNALFTGPAAVLVSAVEQEMDSLRGEYYAYYPDLAEQRGFDVATGIKIEEDTMEPDALAHLEIPDQPFSVDGDPFESEPDAVAQTSTMPSVPADFQYAEGERNTALLSALLNPNDSSIQNMSDQAVKLTVDITMNQPGYKIKLQAKRQFLTDNNLDPNTYQFKSYEDIAHTLALAENYPAAAQAMIDGNIPQATFLVMHSDINIVEMNCALYRKNNPEFAEANNEAIRIRIQEDRAIADFVLYNSDYEGQPRDVILEAIREETPDALALLDLDLD